MLPPGGMSGVNELTRAGGTSGVKNKEEEEEAPGKISDNICPNRGHTLTRGKRK